MSPTLFRERGYRFFFSREETRMRVHVAHAEGEAKFWLQPEIALAENYRLTAQSLREMETLVRPHEKEIRDAWQRHFPG